MLDHVQLPGQRVLGALLPGGDPEVDHPPPSTVDCKNDWSLSSPCDFVARVGTFVALLVIHLCCANKRFVFLFACPCFDLRCAYRWYFVHAVCIEVCPSGSLDGTRYVRSLQRFVGTGNIYDKIQLNIRTPLTLRNVHWKLITDVSGQTVEPIFKGQADWDCLAFGDGRGRLFRSVRNYQCPLVKSRKIEDLIYRLAEAWNHETQLVFEKTFCSQILLCISGVLVLWEQYCSRLTK